MEFSDAGAAPKPRMIQSLETLRTSLRRISISPEMSVLSPSHRATVFFEQSTLRASASCESPMPSRRSRILCPGVATWLG